MYAPCVPSSDLSQGYTSGTDPEIPDVRPRPLTSYIDSETLGNRCLGIGM